MNSKFLGRLQRELVKQLALGFRWLETTKENGGLRRERERERERRIGHGKEAK